MLQKQKYTSPKYHAMWYKLYDCIGIRRKSGGKNQAFSFGKGSNQGEKRLRAWADDVLKELDNGRTEQNTKKWIDERLAQ